MAQRRQEGAFKYGSDWAKLTAYLNRCGNVHCQLVEPDVLTNAGQLTRCWRQANRWHHMLDAHGYGLKFSLDQRNIVHLCAEHHYDTPGEPFDSRRLFLPTLYSDPGEPTPEMLVEPGEVVPEHVKRLLWSIRTVRHVLLGEPPEPEQPSALGTSSMRDALRGKKRMTVADVLRTARR
jgi:hypothetical protein